MRLGLLVLLWPSLAAGEPERELEVTTLVGGSAFSPVSRWSLNRNDPRPYTDDTMPGYAMLGLSIAWETDPTQYPLQPLRLDAHGKPQPEGRTATSPEFSLQTHGARVMTLAGARLERILDERSTLDDTTWSSLRVWITPHVGVITGPASAVVGLDFVTQVQIGRRWGLALVMGLNFWREPWAPFDDEPSNALARTTTASPSETLWTGQVFAGLAFTLRL